jgi:hypothetical protein
MQQAILQGQIYLIPLKAGQLRFDLNVLVILINIKVTQMIGGQHLTKEVVKPTAQGPKLLRTANRV